jgi:hypothetical protein
MVTSEARATLQTDPVARELLGSTSLARLAYLWSDGTPRVVPMWFHWTGEDLLMGAPPNSPKMKVLAANPDVALTIDSDGWPYQVLSIRGTVSVELVGEIFPEYASMARRYLSDEGGEQFLTLAKQTFSQWTRVTIRPDAVRILDFRTRFPSAWSAGSDDK